MRHILRYLKPYVKSMTLGLTIKVLGTFMDLGLPWVLAYILDHVVPGNQIERVFYWGLVMIGLSIFARTFNIMANRMAAKVAAQTTKHIRHDLYEKINTLSGAQMDRFTVPSLISRMTTDTYNIHQMVGMMQRMGVRAPIVILGGIIIMLTMEPVLTLVLIAVLPFLTFVVITISRKSIPLFERVQQKLDRMINVLRENITGIRVIKALSKTEYEKKRFREVNEELIGAELKAAGTMAASSPFLNLFLNIGLTMVVVVGAFRVNSGTTDAGTIVAFLSYFTMILNTILMVNRIFMNLTKASASANRLSEVLLEEEELKVVDETDIMPQWPKNDKNLFPPHIGFYDVSFRYHSTGERSLNNINLTLKQGETLGIIGPTGCGKTTLINLLMRFYDVESGAICIDGRDVRTMSKQDLRKRFGVVFQNDMIFEDTIEENISFCRQIPLMQVAEAAQDACASGFIDQLADKEEGTSGYQYCAAIKGANLSGGQKQRILIARAFAAKPEILILDDASSALDYKTDARLRKALKEKYQEATIILVAQRISSVMSLDHIMVMEEGRIIGYGTHEELMQKCEVYQDIYISQMAS